MRCFTADISSGLPDGVRGTFKGVMEKVSPAKQVCGSLFVSCPMWHNTSAGPEWFMIKAQHLCIWVYV